MNKLKVTVDDTDILKYIDNLSSRYEYIVDEEIARFMEQLRKSSVNYHPWITRSGILERSHKYEKLSQMEWQFVIDTTQEGAEYNYAPLLEFNLLNYSKSYTWFNPNYQRLHPELISNIKNRIYGEGIGGKIKKFFGGLGKFFGI